MTNWPLNIAILGAALFGGALLWTKLAPDAVGYKARVRRQAAGLQGRLDDWLYWEAPLGKPNIERAVDADLRPRDNPWLRAVQAVVRKEALQSDIPSAEAYERLKTRYVKPLPAAFLRGEVGRCVRLHWRTRYHGPDNFYLLWFYAVASVRYGHRHLKLEALAASLKEFRDR